MICEAIMNRAPVAVVRLNHEVPAKLEDIINKALEKDINLRYQHASEMRGDLQRLKRDTDTGRRALPTDTGSVQTSAVAAGTSSSGLPQRSAVSAVGGSAATVPAAKRPSYKLIASKHWRRSHSWRWPLPSGSSSSARPPLPHRSAKEPSPYCLCRTWEPIRTWIFFDSP